MKKYWKVYEADDNGFSVSYTKEDALATRKKMQDAGCVRVQIRLKKGESRISDYHQGGY